MAAIIIMDVAIITMVIDGNQCRSNDMLGDYWTW